MELGLDRIDRPHRDSCRFCERDRSVGRSERPLEASHRPAAGASDARLPIDSVHSCSWAPPGIGTEPECQLRSGTSHSAGYLKSRLDEAGRAEKQYFRGLGDDPDRAHEPLQLLAREVHISGRQRLRQLPGGQLNLLGESRDQPLDVGVQRQGQGPKALMDTGGRGAFAAETGREYWTGIAGTANQRFHRQKELGLTARR